MPFNRCLFSGYIYYGQDQNGQNRERGELKQTQGGNKYVRFTIQVPKIGKDASGNKKDPNWVDCIAWDKTAERICNQTDSHGNLLFRRGQPVEAETRYDQNKYNAQDGTKRVSHDFVIITIELPPVNFNLQNQQAQQGQYQQPAQQAPQQQYQQPQGQYQQPQAPQQYQQPQGQYQQPQAPQQQYQQPAPQAPQQQYQQPQAPAQPQTNPAPAQGQGQGQGGGTPPASLPF